jgi:uncharacterized membrane protein YjjP (DUF1212 family)
LPHRPKGARVAKYGETTASATDLIIALGRAYHQAGVPADTLEEILHAVAVSLGVELQVNALPTSLTVAVGPGRLNLRKLALLNVVYQGLVGRAIDVGTTLTEIASIDANVRPRPPVVTIVAYALLSLGASVLLGGGLREVQVSTLVGVAIGAIGAAADRYDPVNRMFEVIAAFVATLVVAGYERLVGPVALYITIVAGVVQLLPGFTLTTALHELASRHLVAGTARLGGVLVTLLSLGCGFALALAIVGSSRAARRGHHGGRNLDHFARPRARLRVGMRIVRGCRRYVAYFRSLTWTPSRGIRQRLYCRCPHQCRIALPPHPSSRDAHPRHFGSRAGIAKLRKHPCHFPN